MYMMYLTDIYNYSSSDAVAQNTLLSGLVVKKLNSRYKRIGLPHMQNAPDILSDDRAGI